jgi:hypothetical protein
MPESRPSICTSQAIPPPPSSAIRLAMGETQTARLRRACRCPRADTRPPSALRPSPFIAAFSRWGRQAEIRWAAFRHARPWVGKGGGRVVNEVDRELKHAMPVTARRRLEAR